MAPVLRLTLVLATAMSVVSCGAFTDPAVRAATCLEEAASAHPSGSPGPFDWPCDLQLKGSAVVLLHPAGDLPDASLVAAGVPPFAVPAIRSLRLGPQEAIFVVPLVGTERSSRTTYQARFVSVPHPSAAVVSSSRVTFTLRATARPSAKGVSLEVIHVR